MCWCSRDRQPNPQAWRHLAIWQGWPDEAAAARTDGQRDFGTSYMGALPYGPAQDLMKRPSPLKSDPAKVQAFNQRARENGREGMKSTALRHATAPARVPLKRKPAVRKTIDRQAREAWAKAARAKPCAVCGAKGSRGHHIINQQQLRKVADARATAASFDPYASAPVVDFERIRWDRRNLLPLCDRHHAAHHARTHPVPMAVVLAHAPKVMQLARELGCVPWLERTYPA